jgi:serine/threonine-protein kinase
MDIVHRDLKPANIFLQRHHEDELVKILDFGIAKRLGSDQDATGTGSMVGSPSYMSPEQMRNSKNVDCRADLWSVGVILFRCLTGRLPFPATEIAEAVLQICVEPIARPSSIASDLGPDVDRFFERALERDPAKRFQSAREVIDAFSMLAGVRMASADWSEFRLPLPPALPIEGPPMKPGAIVAPESSLSLSENPTLPRALSPVSAPSAATVSNAQSAIAVPPSGFLMPAPEHGGEIVTVGNTLAPAGRSHAASSPPHKRRSHRVLALAIGALVLVALTGLIVTPRRSKPASETSYTDASSNASCIATPVVVAPPPPPAVLPTSGPSVAPTSSSPRVPIEATVTSGQSVMAKPSAMPSVRTTVQQPNKPPLPAPPLKATKTNSTLGF